MDATGIRGLAERYFFEISGGEARRALVAKALISDPMLFIFDEQPHKGQVLRKASTLYVPQNIALFYTESMVEKEVVEMFKARGMKSKVGPGLDVVRRLS